MLARLLGVSNVDCFQMLLGKSRKALLDDALQHEQRRGRLMLIIKSFYFAENQSVRDSRKWLVSNATQQRHGMLHGSVVV